MALIHPALEREGALIHHRCSSVEEFMESLVRYSSSDSLGGTIFRGAADISWGLVPAALRTAPVKNKRDTPAEQCRYEWALLLAFVRSVDRLGLPLPGNVGPDDFVSRTRAVIDAVNQDATQIGGYDHYPLEMLQVAALAQHHGVPTRLLDWTEDPIVAAHFSCASVDQEGEVVAPERQRFGVWVLRDFGYDSALTDGRVNSSSRLRRINVPRSISPRLALQRATFTIVNPVAEGPSVDWWIKPLDQLDAIETGMQSPGGFGSPLCLVSLPVVQMPYLRAHITNGFRVSPASLMGDFDTCAVEAIRNVQPGYVSHEVTDRFERMVAYGLHDSLHAELEQHRGALERLAKASNIESHLLLRRLILRNLGGP